MLQVREDGELRLNLTRVILIATDIAMIWQ
jgi:hypothetical protein